MLTLPAAWSPHASAVLGMSLGSAQPRATDGRSLLRHGGIISCKTYLFRLLQLLFFQVFHPSERNLHDRFVIFMILVRELAHIFVIGVESKDFVTLDMRRLVCHDLRMGQSGRVPYGGLWLTHFTQMPCHKFFRETDDLNLGRLRAFSSAEPFRKLFGNCFQLVATLLKVIQEHLVDVSEQVCNFSPKVGPLGYVRTLERCAEESYATNRLLHGSIGFFCALVGVNKSLVAN